MFGSVPLKRSLSRSFIRIIQRTLPLVKSRGRSWTTNAKTRMPIDIRRVGSETGEGISITFVPVVWMAVSTCRPEHLSRVLSFDRDLVIRHSRGI
ncbi:uncharacterized protein B0H64DRAFT_440886 [Chaetomium fimeti]|uniref:Uncharacterized protein n=1 Tax=Chaetomium fimeti TaxID=1854472 RepID=A0AAE0HJ23_9PEZI|nr:hypothetical protein B0H64DRAFT_440886 [Chaetomium fimeti]